MSGALHRKAIEARVIAELRLAPKGSLGKDGLRKLIAAELGACSASELAGAIQGLRYQGKLHWAKLELSPSMRTECVSHADADIKSGPCKADEQGAGEETASRPSGARLRAAPAPVSEREGEPAAGASKPPALDARPTGRALYQELAAEGERRGLKPCTVSRLVFGNGSQMSMMKKADGPVTQRTWDKARAWLDAPPAAAGPDDDDDCPGEVNDELDGGTLSPPEGGREAVRAGPPPDPALHRARTKGGIHAAPTRWGSRPPPAPRHEPELARAVREEAIATGDRRRRASSTATVRRPLELGELSPADAIATGLAEHPTDLMGAIRRRHEEAWRRVVRLGQARHVRASATLYDVLEAGLEALETTVREEARDAA